MIGGSALADRNSTEMRSCDVGTIQFGSVFAARAFGDESYTCGDDVVLECNAMPALQRRHASLKMEGSGQFVSASVGWFCPWLAFLFKQKWQITLDAY